MCGTQPRTDTYTFAGEDSGSPVARDAPEAVDEEPPRGRGAARRGRSARAGVLAPTLLAFVASAWSSSAVYLRQRLRRRRGRPAAPAQAAPAGRRRRALGPRLALVAAAALLAGRVARRSPPPPSWPCWPWSRRTSCCRSPTRCWLKHEPVLDLAMSPPASCCARSPVVSRAGPADLAVVPAGRRLRVAVHRRGQALLRAAHAGQRGGHPALPGPLHRHLPPFVWSIAAAATLMSYCLWAFEMADGARRAVAHVSIAPFVVGLLRYAVDIDAGEAAEPEDIVLGRPVLQVHRRALAGPRLPRGARCLSVGGAACLTGWGRTAPTARHGRAPDPGGDVAGAGRRRRAARRDRPRPRPLLRRRRAERRRRRCSLPLPGRIDARRRPPATVARVGRAPACTT